MHLLSSPMLSFFLLFFFWVRLPAGLAGHSERSGDDT